MNRRFRLTSAGARLAVVAMAMLGLAACGGRATLQQGYSAPPPPQAYMAPAPQPTYAPRSSSALRDYFLQQCALHGAPVQVGPRGQMSCYAPERMTVY